MGGGGGGPIVARPRDTATGDEADEVGHVKDGREHARRVRWASGESNAEVMGISTIEPAPYEEAPMTIPTKSRKNCAHADAH